MSEYLRWRERRLLTMDYVREFNLSHDQWAILDHVWDTINMDHFSREFPVELTYPQRFVLRKAQEVYPERLQIIKRW